jgi:predicted pyridoxine 5'-phosphate oxidase superfamily flavin-nucleotide-binding protein
MLLQEPIRQLAQSSVLCWLATVDAFGQPHVSPKEVFAVVDDRHVVIANIASPHTVRNISSNPKVCLSFVDVFVQKGFKLQGLAHTVASGEFDYSAWAAPLEQRVQGKFNILSVIVVKVLSVDPILAPSYRFYPQDTTEQSQIDAAMQRYGVKPRD